MRDKIGKFFKLSLLANHFPALHGIRFIAIVSVLQVHVTSGLEEIGCLHNRWFSLMSKQIFFGMDLFFILSGFLIGMILLHSLDKENKGGGIIRFYIRRSFRTFPLYYVVLTLLVVIFPLTMAQKSNLIWEYLYLTNYGDAARNTRVMSWGWSLCVEEHFYLAVPIFIIALHRFRSHAMRISILAVMWLSALAIRLYILFSSPVPLKGFALFQSLYIRTHTRFDILVAGIFLAYLQSYFGPQIKKSLSRFPVRMVLWSVTLVCLATLVIRPPILGSRPLFAVFAWGTITSIMYIPLILLLVNADGWFQRFCSRPFFLRLATVGYGIYLVHIPVGLFILPVMKTLAASFDLPESVIWCLMLFTLVSISAVVAYVFHLLVEKPALYLRDRIAP